MSSVLCLLCLCARLFICALWSPAGKGLTSWLSFVVSTVSLSLSDWYPGSGVVLDCIDSWSLHPYLLCMKICVEQKSKTCLGSWKIVYNKTAHQDVLPYDQIESVTLVDAKWTQSVQTPNPVALTEFPGRIWPLLVVFKAADRGMTQEVMICRVKMFGCWWAFKPTVSPVITMAIHTFVQWAFI